MKRTQTSSGLDIISVDSEGCHSGALVGFRAGSRYEDQFSHGAAFQLARMIYFANASDKTNVTVTRDLLDTTSDNFARSSREMLSYELEFGRDSLSVAVPQLGEITQPKLRGWEVSDAKTYLESEGAEEPIDEIIEAAHWVAFKGGDLAKNRGPNFDGMSELVMKDYRNRFLNRNNAVVVGVNVEHEEFVNLVEQGFSVLPSGDKASPDGAKYVGGESHAEFQDHPTFAIAFNSAGRNNSKEFFCSSILAEVLGSTASRLYRKPRPGHGLASRLNKEFSGDGNVMHLQSFVSNYCDAGLFGVSGQAISGEEGVVVEKVASQLALLAKNALTDAELNAAKNNVKMSFYETSEEVLDRARFYAHQALYSNEVLSRDDFISKIDSISAKDVQSTAKKMFSEGPTLVSEGNSNAFPSLSKLSSILN